MGRVFLEGWWDVLLFLVAAQHGQGGEVRQRLNGT